MCHGMFSSRKREHDHICPSDCLLYSRSKVTSSCMKAPDHCTGTGCSSFWGKCKSTPQPLSVSDSCHLSLRIDSTHVCRCLSCLGKWKKANPTDFFVRSTHPTVKRLTIMTKWFGDKRKSTGNTRSCQHVPTVVWHALCPSNTPTCTGRSHNQLVVA